MKKLFNSLPFRLLMAIAPEETGTDGGTPE